MSEASSSSRYLEAPDSVNTPSTLALSSPNGSVLGFLERRAGDEDGADPPMRGTTLRFVDRDVEKQYRLHHARSWKNLWIISTKVVLVASLVLLFLADLSSSKPLLMVLLRSGSVITQIGLYLYARQPAEKIFWNAVNVFAGIDYGFATMNMIGRTVEVADGEYHFYSPSVHAQLVLASATCLSLFFVESTGWALFVMVVDFGFSFVGETLVWAHIMRVVVFVVAIMATRVNDLNLRRQYVAMQRLKRQQEGMELEQTASRHLLLNILPIGVIEEVQHGREDVVLEFEACTAFWCDVAGFSSWCAQQTSSEAIVAAVHRLFCIVDDLACEHGLEKVVTVGDAVLCVAGMYPAAEDHAVRAARFALAVVEAVAADARLDFSIRIGLASGPLTGAVLGRDRVLFSVFGAAVDEAMRLEAAGAPGRINVGEATAAQIPAASGLVTVPGAAGQIFVLGERDGMSRRRLRLRDSLAVAHKAAADLDPRTLGMAMDRNSSGNQDGDGDGSGKDDETAAAMMQNLLDAGDGNMANVLLDKSTFLPWRMRFRDPGAELEFRASTALDVALLKQKQAMVALVAVFALLDFVETPTAVRYDLVPARVATLVLLVAALLVWRRAALGETAQARLAIIALVAFDVVLVGGTVAAALSAPVEARYGPTAAEWIERIKAQVYIMLYLVALLGQGAFTTSLGLVVLLHVGTLYSWIGAGPDEDGAGNAPSLTVTLVFVIVGRLIMERNRRALFLLGRVLLHSNRSLQADILATENLLLQILPAHLLEALHSTDRPSLLAESAADASLVFVRLVAGSDSIADVRRHLDAVDAIVREEPGCTRIKCFAGTIFVAAGLGGGSRSDSAQAATSVALGVIEQLGSAAAVGVATGPVTAGIVGKVRFAYDAWGADVNLAARLASGAEPGTAVVSSATAAAIGTVSGVVVEPLASREYKGCGVQATFQVSHATTTRTGGITLPGAM